MLTFLLTIGPFGSMKIKSCSMFVIFKIKICGSQEDIIMAALWVPKN